MTKIRNWLIGLCLTVFLLATSSSARAQIGELPEIPENMDIDVSLDFESGGSFHLTVDVVASVLGEEIEQLPITSADVDIEISSPSSGQLKIELNGSVTFYENVLGDLPLENLSTMTPGMLNLMLQEFEGEYLSDILFGITGEEVELPPEVGDLVIDSIDFTEFSWDEPALMVGVTATISGSVFEDEELRDELPVTINLSFEGDESSLSLSITASSQSVEFEMSLEAILTDDTWDVSLSIEAEGVLPEFEEKGLGGFEIPSGARDLLGEQDLSEAFGGQNITFELTVPGETDVSELPGGYDQSDGTYTWTGSDAAGAFESLITGEAGPEGGPGEEEELPWLWIGIGVAAVVVIIIAIVAARR